MSDVKCTAAQFKAVEGLAARYPEQAGALLARLEVVADDEVSAGSYLGLWVGSPRWSSHFQREMPGSLFLGIERDGYTHS